jgi:hypothetical protein
MDILDNKTDQELLRSLVAESAKAQNELRCAQKDLQKAQSRLNFIIVLVNELINRKGD